MSNLGLIPHPIAVVSCIDATTLTPVGGNTRECMLLTFSAILQIETKEAKSFVKTNAKRLRSEARATGVVVGMGEAMEQAKVSDA